MSPYVPERRGGRIRGIGRPGATVEDEIRGNVQQAGVAGPGRARQMPRSKTIHTPGRFDLVLGPINGGVGRRVDDDRRGVRLDHAADSIRITDIQVRARQADRDNPNRDARQQASSDPGPGRQ